MGPKTDKKGMKRMVAKSQLATDVRSGTLIGQLGRRKLIGLERAHVRAQLFVRETIANTRANKSTSSKFTCYGITINILSHSARISHRKIFSIYNDSQLQETPTYSDIFQITEKDNRCRQN